jgi:hypothetical protein
MDAARGHPMCRASHCVIVSNTEADGNKVDPGHDVPSPSYTVSPAIGCHLLVISDVIITLNHLSARPAKIKVTLTI